MSNERLSAAITSAGMTLQDFSDRVGVDPKTAERWITKDRLPHRTHRMTAASLLGKSDGFLWPATHDDGRSRSATESEFVGLYPSRGAVPTSTWTDLLDQATESIDLLAYSASFLHDSVPQFAERLAAQADAGVRVRLLFGDPSSEAVSLRGHEEGIDDLMAARCRLTWNYYKPVLASSLIQARQHGTTLYASMFRFDDVLLVNSHVYGTTAGQAPAFHINRIAGGRLFAHYLDSYERVWQSGEPVEPWRA